MRKSKNLISYSRLSIIFVTFFWLSTQLSAQESPQQTSKVDLSDLMEAVIDENLPWVKLLLTPITDWPNDEISIRLKLAIHEQATNLLKEAICNPDIIQLLLAHLERHNKNLILNLGAIERVFKQMFDNPKDYGFTDINLIKLSYSMNLIRAFYYSKENIVLITSEI